MEKQQTFASAVEPEGQGDAPERFLAEMDAVIPWSRRVGLIEPHDPHTGKGRPPHELERMLRIYFLQHLANLYAVRHRLVSPQARCVL